MLASDKYYTSKFSSTVLTSLITGESPGGRHGFPAFKAGCDSLAKAHLHLTSTADTACKPQHATAGAPIIADQRMLDAYTMLDKESTFYQVCIVTLPYRMCSFIMALQRKLVQPWHAFTHALLTIHPPRTNPTQAANQSELDVMFQVAKLPPAQLWAKRAGVAAAADRLNDRAQRMIAGWLEKKGVRVVPGERRLTPKRKSNRRLRVAAAGGGGAAAGLRRRLAAWWRRR